MTVFAEDDYPGLRQWQKLDDGMRDMLLVTPPGEAWLRGLPDDSRGGLPAVVLEVCWLESAAVRRIAQTGITLDSARADGVDDRELLEDLTILRSSIVRTHVSLGADGKVAAELADGTVYDDLPLPVVAQLL